MAQGGWNKKDPLTEKEKHECAVLAGYGLPMEKMAAYFRRSKDTLERQVKTDPELAAALEKGRANMSAELRQLAMEQARKGSVPMIIFLLKTKEGFRETDRLELSGPNGGPIESNKELGVEEATALLAKYERILARKPKEA